MSGDAPLLIPRELAQALHDYLMMRPMAEVEQLVAKLRTLKPATPDGLAE